MPLCLCPLNTAVLSHGSVWSSQLELGHVTQCVPWERGAIICCPCEGREQAGVSESPAAPEAPPGAVLPHAAQCKTEPEGFAGLTACPMAL